MVIGSDCPGLTPAILAAALDRLSESPVVFGPANDGGYYLIGLSRMVPELFRGIAWGKETVLADSLRALAKAGNAIAALKANLALTAKVCRDGQSKTTSHFQKAVLKIGDYLIVLAVAMVGLILGVALFRGDKLTTTLQFALVLRSFAKPSLGS